MGTAIMFLLGSLVILGISRYNEDDRLFWKLFASMSIAFMIVSIADTITTNKDTDSPKIEKVAPQLNAVDSNVNTAIFAPVATTGKSPSKQTWAMPDSIIMAGQTIIARPQARGQPCSCNCHKVYMPNKIPIPVGIQDDS